MNNIQLFLNDKPVDLSDDNPIALTFQINDLAEVQNQQGNTSNQFKIPLTQNNRAILGYADDISIENQNISPQMPYSQLTAKVVQNGIEVFPNAVAEINQVDDDTASITILSGNVSFFDSLGGQIADMGDSTSQWSGYGANLVWKPFDHEWNLQNVAGSQQNTEQDGWIYPIVDYGLIDPANFSAPINVLNQRPGFFIKKAIDLLVQSTGYTARGSLLNDPLYPLLIAQFSNGSWEHGFDYQNVLNQVVTVELSQNLNAVHNTNQDDTGNIGWPYIVTNWNNQFIPGTGFVAAARESVAVTVIVPHLQFTGHVAGGTPSYLNIIIWLKTPGYPDANLGQLLFDFSGGFTRQAGTDGSGLRGTGDIYNSKITVNTELQQGQGLYIGYEFHGDHPASFTLFSGAQWSVAAQNETVKYGQMVQCERILPDISQKDFLKDTLQRFGFICQTDVYTKSIIFASLNDIVNNIPIAKDWSSKCVDQGKQLNYTLGSYAQVNYMEFPTDPNILPLKLGWDEIIINDKTLSTVANDMLVSKFGPSLNRPFYGGTIAEITMIDNTTAVESDTANFSIGVQPRILVDQKIDLRNYNNASVTFTDTVNNIVVNNIISVPYFYKPDGIYNLCWCDMPSTNSQNPLPGLKSNYYGPLQKILQNTKVLVRYFLLTPRDIAELDLLIPVYLQQHNAYFYINKIDSWRKGQPCKVELVKLG